MKLSVVIPVYNVAPWLRECLDSVRAQTLRDWECICVDDGSTDRSPDILKEFSSSDPRFRILTRPHSNAGAARNAGLDEAKGDFLLFLDSDDVFSPWMFETLVEAAEHEGADIAICSSVIFRDGEHPNVFSAPGTIKWNTCIDDCSKTTTVASLGGAAWNKLISRNLIEKQHLRFLEQPSTNDYTFAALAMVLSQKPIFADIPFVGYRQRTNSIQTTKSSVCFFAAIQAILDRLKYHGCWDSLSNSKRDYLTLDIIYQCICHLRSQKSWKGYWASHSGIRSLKMDDSRLLSRLDTRLGVNGIELLSVRRYRSIVKNGPKERIHAILESLLAPLIGDRIHLAGRKARFANCLNRVLVSAFESTKWPWNR